jgi:hypothetical protein
MSKIISFAGLLTTFVMAYASDHLIEVVRRRALVTFSFTPYLLLASVINILVAIILFLLTWYVVFRADKSALISSAFVLIGLVLTFVSTLVPGLISDAAFMPPSHMLHVAAFAIVIGIAGFIIPKQFKS